MVSTSYHPGSSDIIKPRAFAFFIVILVTSEVLHGISQKSSGIMIACLSGNIPHPHMDQVQHPHNPIEKDLPVYDPWAGSAIAVQNNDFFCSLVKEVL